MSGCAIGIALTFPVGHAFSTVLGDYFPVFQIDRTTICLDIAFSLLVGTAAAVFPAWRAARIRIADGLRRIG
jgi:putative ABC transport system permease protein